MQSFEDVAEILVTLKSGEKCVYRGKGLNKFKRLLVSVPTSPLIVEDDEDPQAFPSSQCPGGVCPVKPKKKKTKSVSSPSNYGYKTMDMNYSPAGGSPYQVAQMMKSEAAKHSSIVFD